MAVKPRTHSGPPFNGSAGPRDELIDGRVLLAGAGLGVLVGVIIAIVTLVAANIGLFTSERMMIVCAVVMSGTATAMVRHQRRRRPA